jgi:hydroxymethylpyrimidine kinase/phosphomethylpyrimidine kinase
MTPRILVIAGSDSGGGAGIQADIKTITMLGGHAMTAITAITAQNTLGVSAVHAVPTEMVIAQIDAVLSDIGADAVKIGMIGSAATAEAVATRIEEIDVPIVFDPVMVATSGSVLADEETITAFQRLMRLSTLVTPNAPELRALTGGDGEDAARQLAERTGTAVLAKGRRPSWPNGHDLLIRVRTNEPLGRCADRKPSTTMERAATLARQLQPNSDVALRWKKPFSAHGAMSGQRCKPHPVRAAATARWGTRSARYPSTPF